MKKIISAIYLFLTVALFSGVLYAEGVSLESGNVEQIGKIESSKEGEKSAGEIKHYTSFKITKRIKLKSQADLASVQCRVPLMRDDFRGQITKRANIYPNYNALFKDPDQNNIAMFYVSNVKSGQEINLVMEYEVDIEDSDFFVSPAEAGEAKDSIDANIEKYLKTDSEIDVDDPVIRDKAQKISKGYSNPFSKGKSIYNFIANNIKYENTEEVSGFQSPVNTLRIKRGNCADMARLFIALARASGIPSRQVNGMVFSPDVSANKSIKKYEHAWAEIYLPKYGWLPVDPTTGVTSREDYYCFNYKIHIRESYGPLIQRAPGSLYKGMYIEARTYGKADRFPMEEDFSIEVDLLSW